MKKATKPAPARPGRKTLDPNGEVMKVHKLRTTDAQWARLQKLGGAEAFRAWLDSQR